RKTFSKSIYSRNASPEFNAKTKRKLYATTFKNFQKIELALGNLSPINPVLFPIKIIVIYRTMSASAASAAVTADTPLPSCTMVSFKKSGCLLLLIFTEYRFLPGVRQLSYQYCLLQ